MVLSSFLAYAFEVPREESIITPTLITIIIYVSIKFWVLRVLSTVRMNSILFRILSGLSLFKVRIRSSLCNQKFCLFPFKGQRRRVFPTRAPRRSLYKPVPLRSHSFVIFRRLLRFHLIARDGIGSLMRVTNFQFLLFVRMGLSMNFNHRVSMLKVQF